MKRQHSLNLTFLLCCLVAPIFAQDCGVGEYKCENSGICIGVDQICDGTVDCPDNEEDEWTCTGKSFSEALILASTHPQYDKRLSIDLPVLTRKLQAQNMLCTYIVFCFVLTIKTIYVHNLF